MGSGGRFPYSLLFYDEMLDYVIVVDMLNLVWLNHGCDIVIMF